MLLREFVPSSIFSDLPSVSRQVFSLTILSSFGQMWETPGERHQRERVADVLGFKMISRPEAVKRLLEVGVVSSMSSPESLGQLIKDALELVSKLEKEGRRSHEECIKGEEEMDLDGSAKRENESVLSTSQKKVRAEASSKTAVPSVGLRRVESAPSLGEAYISALLVEGLDVGHFGGGYGQEISQDLMEI